MSRPLVRYVRCDGCGTQVEHHEGQLGVGSQWIPPRWAEIFHRVDGGGDEAKHVCGVCKAEVMETLEMIQRRHLLIK